MEFDQLSNQVIGCAIEVHRTLGPGLLESAYRQCLAYELSRMDVRFEMEKSIVIDYKGIAIQNGFRADLIVEEKLLLELKSVERLLAIHETQILTYMKLAKVATGLLINFNVPVLKNGIKRFVL